MNRIGQLSHVNNQRKNFEVLDKAAFTIPRQTIKSSTITKTKKKTTLIQTLVSKVLGKLRASKNAKILDKACFETPINVLKRYK